MTTSQVEQPAESTPSKATPEQPKEGVLPSGKHVREIAAKAKKGEFAPVEKILRQKVVMGRDVINRIEDAVREGLIGTEQKFRPGSYITVQIQMADLAISAKEDLQAKEKTPIKRRGGSLNEVFITQSYVVKAEGTQSAKKIMIAMERFSYDMAHFLGLEEPVLPTTKVKLTVAQAKALHLTSELQEQVKKNGEIEVNLARYTEFKSVEGALSLDSKSVDIDSFQLAGLFSGVTQQTDHHADNGGMFLDSATQKLKFILFDNDLCLQESNMLIKVRSESGDELVVPIRSFFTAFACADEPLSSRAREIVSKWDEASVRKFCELHKGLLTEGQIKALCQRINVVKHLVETNPVCTLNQCFEAMYPFLKTYKELFLMLNPSPLYSSSAKLDCVTLAFSPGGGPSSPLSKLLESALLEKKISEATYKEIKAKIEACLAAGDFQDLRPK